MAKEAALFLGRTWSIDAAPPVNRPATFVPKLLGCPLHLQKAGDRGALARASGDYGIIVSHNVEQGITRIKLPSGSKKVGCTPADIHTCTAAHDWVSQKELLLDQLFAAAPPIARACVMVLPEQEVMLAR